MVLIVPSVFRENRAAIIQRIHRFIRRIKSEIKALYLAVLNPDTPWYAKILAAGIIAYAFSPVDIIPDFIPILGYIDDLVLLPMAISCVIRVIPGEIINDCRNQSQKIQISNVPGSRTVSLLIFLIWILTLWFALKLF